MMNFGDLSNKQKVEIVEVDVLQEESEKWQN
jgi:hypothetical protein